MRKIIRLTQLELNLKAKLLKIVNKGSLKKKFLDMGLIPGTVIEILKIAPLGDPIDIKVRGYQLSLRKNEAENIIVEVI
jgi:ferrous iron transport protein A